MSRTIVLFLLIGNEDAIEGQLSFTFPVGAVVFKYDDWSFYRKQFNNAFGGTKAVDIIFVVVDRHTLKNYMSWSVKK